MRVGRVDVPVTNPDKPFFPERGLTKLDLVSYYVDVAPLALPHLRRRPFHMKRFTDGVTGEFFHQKRVPKNHPSYVDEIFVQFPSGHSTVFAVVDDAAGLAWVANLGCIELHTWHSRVPEIERPDYLLIDLDPTTDGQWPFVREIALVVREVMDELGLRSYPEDVGRDGPAHPGARSSGTCCSPTCAAFAKALAEEVERRIDDQTVATTTWRVADRVGVFVDFGQNARDRTIASAYSVRPTPDARVSAPLELGRGRGRRAGGVHDRDDARADRRRRRPDARHVAQPAVAALTLREARLEPPTGEQRLDAAAFGSRGGRTSRHVQSAGSLSSRQRMNFVPWRKRLPCTLS